MILLRPEELTESAARYLQMVQPTQGAPNDQLNDHGWILGNTDCVSWTAQADIDALLEARISSNAIGE